RRQHVKDFLLCQWHWIMGIADKASNTGSMAYRSPSVFSHIHPNQDIAWNTHAVNNLAYRVFDFDDFLHRNFDFVDIVFDLERLTTCFKVRFHPTLVARVGVNYIPVAWGTT